jgi:glycosyltransferase involved in cell wall biosynthesis
MTPAFTVVIPLHQAEAFIRRCLQSVEEQTHPATETIVVDDGSTDGGAAIVADEFPWVRLLTQPNQGVSSARNLGIATAESDWVAFLDADDFWFPSHLRELAGTIGRFPGAKLVANRFERWRDGEPLPSARPATTRQAIRYFREASRDINVVWSSATAADRDALLAVGGFPPFAQGEDLACWAAIGLRHPVAVSDALTSVYVQHPASARATSATADATPQSSVAAPTFASISPSAGVVAAALESGDHSCDPADLRLYLDSRVNASIRGALAAGDRSAAAGYRRLRTRRFRPQFWSVHLAERMPPRLLQMLRGARPS